MLVASTTEARNKARKRGAKPPAESRATSTSTSRQHQYFTPAPVLHDLLQREDLLHPLPSRWETGTLRELRAYARFGGVSAEQLDDELDEWLEQPDADVRAGITELVRKAASAQSAGFGSKSTFDGELTTAFIQALMPTAQRGMGNTALALQILTGSPGQVDPNALFPFGTSLTPVLSHTVRIYMFLAHQNPLDPVYNRGHDGEQSGTSFALIQALLEQGAATSAMDPSCVPPMIYAAYFKSVRLVKLLVDHGARCDVGIGGPKTRGYSPLHAAAESDPRATMSTLAKLHEAVRRDGTESMPIHLWYEAFPSAVDYTGVPSAHHMYEGFEFEDFRSLFTRAVSGEEIWSFSASDALQGLQQWTGASTDLLLGTNTCDFQQQDLKGRSALHHAAMFGNLRAAQKLISAGAPIDLLDVAGFTALHYAARRGYKEIVAALADNMDSSVLGVKGLFGLQFTDMLPTWETRAWEPAADRDLGGWRGGSDSDEMLPDHCDLPEIKKEDFTGELFGRHVTANKPFIVRGYGLDWKMRTAWRRDNFLRKYGHLRFTTGRVGYAAMLGFDAPQMSVHEYVEYMESDDKDYNNTLYIFQNGISRSHPELSTDFEMFPEIIKQIPREVGFQNGGEAAGEQFYLGPKDTGAQPHTHAHAWNMMAYGRKLWYMWSPDKAFYTTVPTRPFVDQVIRKLPAEERPMECIQEAGDFVYVPSGWGHAALNLEDSIGIAIGFRDAYANAFYANDRCFGHEVL